MKYLALLRGINVGGNNKVAMIDLRTCFEKLGFTSVSTYINSGNIFFETAPTEPAKLVRICEAAIEKTFGFKVVITVISKTEFAADMAKAPAWWGVGERQVIRSEALFAIPPVTAEQILKSIKVGNGPDKLQAVGQIVFWTLPTAAYNKSIVPKIIGTPVYKNFTMRSANTTKKLLELINL